MSIALSTTLVVVVVDGRVCWRHLYDNRRVVAVYYKSINCNPLTRWLRFVVDLLYNLFLQLTRFWLTARSAVHIYVVAELLMTEWLTDRLFVSTCMKRIIALSVDALTSGWTEQSQKSLSSFEKNVASRPSHHRRARTLNVSAAPRS